MNEIMKEINNIRDIAELLAYRDNISIEEAYEMINNCRDELLEASSLDEAEDAITYWLNLEPDILDILLF